MPAIETRTTTKALGAPRWFVSFTSHIPPGQFLRYLAVGAANTFVGYGSYALLTALLMPLVRYGYVMASLLAGVVNITFSYLNYKWFVFKTKGNYAQEWLRCIVVYGGGIALGTLPLPLVVFLLRRFAHMTSGAPYLGGAILGAFSVLSGFLGHKNFSFRVPTGKAIQAQVK